MSERPDPDETREIRTPAPDGPTQHIPLPPPAPPPRRRRPPTPIIRAAPQRHIPPPPASPTRQFRPPSGPPSYEVPWWQTINRDRPTSPRPPIATPPPAAPVRQQSSHTAWASRRTGFAWAAVALAALAVAALVVQRPANSPTTVLDITKAQLEIEQILRDPLDGYGLTDVSGVVCNNGSNPVIRQGAAFSCLAVVDGVQREINVVFEDADGTYAVDRPR